MARYRRGQHVSYYDGKEIEVGVVVEVEEVDYWKRQYYKIESDKPTTYHNIPSVLEKDIIAATGKPDRPVKRKLIP